MPDATRTLPTAKPTWDIFCRVIDNFGDIGVCWRLAADLASRGHGVRLWTDDASALAWLAPQGHPGVAVLPWNEATHTAPADTVIEAFGCDPPPPFLQRMAQRVAPPLWMNLEYLSAEPQAERNHGLPSPQLVGPGAGLTKWFFYPGFTPRTGGLMLERDLADRQRRFDAAAWLNSRGLQRQPGERLVSLFCYDNPAIPDLLRALAGQPTWLLTTPGASTWQVHQALAASPGIGVRVAPLPWLTQLDFDHLLWSCDLNVVRGEDSLVRAQWAGSPFVWQAYRQDDGVHAHKVEALLNQFLQHADARLAPELRGLWRTWNGLETGDSPNQRLSLPESTRWHSACRNWRDRLLRQTDLVTQLIGFVVERR